MYDAPIRCPQGLEQEKLYEVIITKTPDEVGFGYPQNWNANIARKGVRDNVAIEHEKFKSE